MTQPRRGKWIQTFTGKQFWPLDPRPEDIDIRDIAHSLAMKCRYGGHTVRFYSVAEHSYYISRAVPPKFAMWGLLHDAAEAYSADIPKPLKQDLTEWAAIESRIMAVVIEHFGLSPEQPEEVTYADTAILADERAAVMAPADHDWQLPYPAIGVTKTTGLNMGWNWSTAEYVFLMRYHYLRDAT